MDADRPLRTGARERARRWGTFQPDRVVLAVARTVTSTVRLLEALSVFDGDARIEVIFTVDESSAFSGGARELLERTGVRPVPAHRVSGLEIDLLLTASENVEFAEPGCPVVVLPHGIGFNKYVPDSAGDGERLSGLVPAARLRGSSICLVTSHESMREQLRADHPEAAKRCVVIGDPAYDRMLASLPLRDRYRRVLGVEGRRLVVLSSTWKDGSLLGRRGDLPARLLRELPYDEYRVALIRHPNIDSWHDAYNVRRNLALARDRGLLLVPPESGWQATLIAADVVVGDHGSVTLYGAALGRPVLLAAAGEEIVPGTPPETLAGDADRLDPGLPLRAQLERAVRTHRADRFAGLTDRMFAHRGDGARRLRELLYDRLGLTPPGGAPRVLALPAPEPSVVEPVSFTVFTDGADTVTVWRLPGAVPKEHAPVSRALRHLAVAEDEPDRLLPANASVLVRRDVAADGDAWVAATLRRYSGARLALTPVDGGYLAGTRDGRLVRVRTTASDPILVASGLYARLRAGTPISGSCVVHAGSVQAALVITDVA